MWARAMPIARSIAYRGFTRLPHESVQRWARRPAGRRAIGALQRALGEGPIEVPGWLSRGLLLDSRALGLTHVQAFGLVRGALEPSVQEALRRHVFAGAVVFDVGANVGFFSLLAARLAGPAGRVEAFEPHPAAAAGLRRNVALNGADTVHVNEVAVGARSGSAELMSVRERSWSHLADRGWHPETDDIIDVLVVTIDDLVAGGMRAPDVVKIDVEGSELDVLQGMRETIATCAPVIICELHATNAEFLAAIGELGYEAFNLDGPEPIAEAGAVHVLAAPGGATLGGG
jgi:FkbM family methyltransferase